MRAALPYIASAIFHMKDMRQHNEPSPSGGGFLLLFCWGKGVPPLSVQAVSGAGAAPPQLECHVAGDTFILSSEAIEFNDLLVSLGNGWPAATLDRQLWEIDENLMRFGRVIWEMSVKGIPKQRLICDS